MTGPYLPGYDAWKLSEPPDDGVPQAACPRCHHLQDDEDGLGVQFCPKCHYCTHAAISDGSCELCGVLDGCPRPDRERCNDPDAEVCCGGGRDAPCSCQECHAAWAAQRDNEAEAAYERAQEEPCFRGGEWAAAQREEALRIKRELKR